MSAPTIFILYAAGHLSLFVCAAWLLVSRRTLATVPLMIVTAGLVYDNAMLALGGSIGVGQQLEQLSVPRYFMHAVSTPLLILTALGLVQRTEAHWSFALPSIGLAVLIVVALVAFGFWTDMITLQLEPEQEGGIVSYGNANSIPVAPIATIIILFAAAAIIWWRGGGPILLVGAVIQFAAAATAEALVFAGNLGELALLAGLVWTDHKLKFARLDTGRAT